MTHNINNGNDSNNENNKNINSNNNGDKKQICKIGNLRKQYLKSDSQLSIKDIKLYLLQKLILYQNCSEEYLRCRVIEIFTEKEKKVIFIFILFYYSVLILTFNPYNIFEFF